MKWAVYNLLFALAFPLMLPGFLVRMLRRGGYRARMGDRFAVYPPEIIAALKSGDFVWVHAVSVGEVQVAGQLMRDWRAADPSVRFCFSTTSSTGWKMAEKEISERDVLIYNPLDFPSFVKSALKTVRPRAIVLTESEIWPVFIRKAQKSGVPLFLINARVSDRSAPRYAKARFFFKDVFRAFTRIFAQSELDKARLVAAGAPEDRIDVTGSFKFDVAHRNPAKEAELRDWIGGDTRRILLGGSTWPGEDEALLRIYGKLLNRGAVRDGSDSEPSGAGARSHELLILAPRHFEKADAVEANIRAAGFDCIRRSRGESAANPGANDPAKAVYLADTTGELMGLYGIADAVFVGKSLCEHGSQNMIEPCLCGKPTVVGPYTENFRPVMSDLLEGEGIVQVADEAGLSATILRWFAEGDGGLGERASRAVARRTGVVPTCTAAIRAAIPSPAVAEEPEFRPLQTLGLTALTIVLFVIALAGTALMVVPCMAPDQGEAESVEEVDTIRRTPRRILPVAPRLKAVRFLGAYLAMLERPDALRVLLVDLEAQQYAAAFAEAGLTCLTPASAEPDRTFDIVLTGTVPENLDWAALTARLKPKGVLACALDVRGMTAARFKAVLESYPSPAPHLWMPGEQDWLLTGCRVERHLKMSALFDFLTKNELMTFMSPTAVEAGCGTLPELFASYVGSRDDLMPVFDAGDLSVMVRADHFVSREVPDLDWIAPDGLDSDIVASLAEGIKRLQAVRRRVIEAAYLMLQGKTEEALTAWAESIVSNPHDTMLQDRLYRLASTARACIGFGDLAKAAQCYDILFAIRPSDLSVAWAYYDTLVALKRTADAKKIKAHIDSVRKAAESEKGKGGDE